MDVEVAIYGNLRAVMESRQAIAAGGLHRAAGLAAREGVGRFRRDVESAGLGRRLANTWRATVYPRRPGTLSPAAFIFTKAEALIRAHDSGPTIRPVKGSVYLWLPTENTPRRGNRRMSPGMVEERFGDFTYVPSITRPGVVFATVDAVRSRSRRGFRKASRGRAGQGRNAIRIIMFVLVRQVRLRKRLNVGRITSELQQVWPEIVSRSLVDAFRNDSGEGA